MRTLACCRGRGLGAPFALPLPLGQDDPVEAFSNPFVTGAVGRLWWMAGTSLPLRPVLFQLSWAPETK